MSSFPRKISLVYFVVVILLLAGMVPLLLTGWIMADRSAVELRAVENRYQIQLVQEKARQIGMFGKSYADLVTSISMALELSNNLAVLSAENTERKLGSALQANPNVLAICVKPVSSESLSVRRSDSISNEDVQAVAIEAMGNSDQKLQIGQPRPLGANGELVMPFSSPVRINDQLVATVVAIVSLKDIGRNIVGVSPTKEETLWGSGVPIIFVVDEQGRAVFHPDPSLVAEERKLNDLKIVQEWRESSRQVDSALVPFTAEYNGKSHDM